MTEQRDTTHPTWVEHARALGERFDIEEHNLVRVLDKLPTLALVDPAEELSDEVGLGLVAAVYGYESPEGYWRPDADSFSEFEPFERLDQDRMLAFVSHLAKRWLTHGRDDRLAAVPFIARFPYPALLEELNTRVFERDDKHKYNNRVKQAIFTALSRSNAPIAWYYLWKMSSNKTGYTWSWSARSAQDDAMERLGIASEEEWREVAIPTFGIDAKRGFRDLDYGSRTIRVSFRVGGIEFLNLATNKTSTSLPRATKADDKGRYEQLRAEYNIVKSGLKEGTENLKGWFEARMHKKDAWSAKFFRDRLVEHPAAIPLLEGLVIAVVGDKERPPTFARLDEDHTFIGLSLEPVDLSRAKEVCIPTREDLGEELGAWIKHMIEFQVIQPFEQLGADDFGIASEHTSAILERIATQKFQVDCKTMRSLAKRKLAKVTGRDSYATETSAIVFEVSPYSLQLIFDHHPLYMAWRKVSNNPLVARGVGIDDTHYTTEDAIREALEALPDDVSVEFLRFLQQIELRPDE